VCRLCVLGWVESAAGAGGVAGADAQVICHEVDTIDSCRDVSAILTPFFSVRRACPMLWALFRGRLRNIP
jgi:hypothetical protein